MSNIIKAVFTGRFCTTRRIWRWDTDDKLQFVNLDLPAAYTVDFANSLTGESKPVLATSDTVQIPPEFFVPGSEVYAWIWISDNNGGYTKCQATIPIDPRAQRTGAEPTPAEASAWDQAVQTLNDAAADYETAISHAPIVQNGYWYIWNPSIGEYENTDVKAAGNDGENGNIIWWTTGKVLADGDNAKTMRRRLNGPDGLTPAVGDYVFGPAIGFEGGPTTLYVIISASVTIIMTALGSIKGNPGADGYAPEVTNEQIEGGHRVTITSAAHPEGQSFDVMDGSGGSVTVDDEISGSSENPVQNKVIKAALDEKANISSVPTKTSDLQNDSGFLTQHQSLAAYRTAAAQDVIDAGKGTYSKPNDGIPKTDLAEAVQTSLGKADTALQPGDVDEPFVVTYTATSGTTATCDKTYAEIMAALQAKQEVLAFYVASNSVAAQLTTVAIDPNNSDILFTNAQNGGVTTLRHNSAGTITVSSNDGYVFRDQGIANAGKFLVVGSDGNVTAMTLAAWQGGNY